MSARFYIGYVLAVLCLVWTVDLVLGSLYVRYIIMYTGGIFLAGLVAGQRYEHSWLQRQQELERSDLEHDATAARVTAGESGGEGTDP
ncbi:MAG TPA: hypothetical protein VLY45_07805 [Nitrospiria bacterium]|nr:hypothetical protein [Nitrospiria bacterium]